MRLVSAYQLASRAASIAVMAPAAVVLFGGWVLGSPGLQSLVPGFPKMMPNAAIGLFLSGASLFLGGGGERKIALLRNGRLSGQLRS
ncbi:MAG: hypothetical protein HYX81_05245 [Chloroflexi bacterium]|nr:hypothetical protein [Chloroflexota bacterium]